MENLNWSEEDHAELLVGRYESVAHKLNNAHILRYLLSREGPGFAAVFSFAHLADAHAPHHPGARNDAFRYRSAPKGLSKWKKDLEMALRAAEEQVRIRIEDVQASITEFFRQNPGSIDFRALKEKVEGWDDFTYEVALDHIVGGPYGMAQSVEDSSRWHLSALDAYQFQHGEQESIMCALTRTRQEMSAAGDSSDRAVQESVYAAVAKELGISPQLAEYVAHTNALKLAIQDDAKYLSFMTFLIEAVAERNYALGDEGHLAMRSVISRHCENMRIQERIIAQKSLNPSFRIDFGGEGTLYDRVQSVFLKLFDSETRWQHECDVASTLLSKGVSSIQPRPITFAENFFENAQMLRSVDAADDCATLSIPGTLLTRDSAKYRYGLAFEFTSGKTLRDILSEEYACNPLIEEWTVLRELNELISTLHDIDPRGMKNLKARDYVECVNERISHVHRIQTAERIPGAELFDGSRRNLESALAQLNELYFHSGIGECLNARLAQRPAVIHGDLHLKNIIQYVPNDAVGLPQRGGNLALIDFEFAGIGLVEEDLAIILAEPLFAEFDADDYAMIAHRVTARYFAEGKADPWTLGLAGIARQTEQIAELAATRERYSSQQFAARIDRHTKPLKRFISMALDAKEGSEESKRNVLAYANGLSELVGMPLVETSDGKAYKPVLQVSVA